MKKNKLSTYIHNILIKMWIKCEFKKNLLTIVFIRLFKFKNKHIHKCTYLSTNYKQYVDNIM